jgi:hypothetical protein
MSVYKESGTIYLTRTGILRLLLQSKRCRLDSRPDDICLRSKLGNTWAGMGVAPQNRGSPGQEGAENQDSGLDRQTCQSCSLARGGLGKASPDSVSLKMFSGQARRTTGEE